jgi:CubicO group peptidase (beta-lactamase class C family)
MKMCNTVFKKIVFCIFAFILFLFLTDDATCAQQLNRDYWPTNGWKISTPEQQGMDSAKLKIAVEFIQERLPDAYSLLVVKNGYLVFEKYFRKGSPDRIAVIHSVTKSFTSALIGIALDKGYLESVDQRLFDFFPEYVTDDLDWRKQEIRLKHLLTMSAGLKWNDWGPELWDWVVSLDWGEYTLQPPQDDYPGNVFNYNSSLSHLLSIILEKSTKISTLEFADQHLFKPLGIRQRHWDNDPQGYYTGGFGLSLTARDLAKLGFLYLNNGYWDGQSIVSEQWVQASTRHRWYAHRVYGPTGYGYQWWVKEVDGFHSYRAWGRRGQFVVVVPKLDLVVVVTSETRQPVAPTSVHYSPLFDLVADAVKRDRPPKKRLKAIELPTDVKAFLNSFNQATADKDMLKISEYVSDNFLSHGVTKNRILAFFKIGAPYMSESKVILTGFERHGNLAKVQGVRKDKYFEIPILPRFYIIKENGQWKWYGNQLSR